VRLLLERARGGPWLLALALLLPCLAVQLRAPVPRIDADAVEYYTHLRSLYFDQDLEFTNEFAHFGILERGDKAQPTATGHRRTIFSVGPALLWMPFYAAGDALARLQGAVEDGYSAAHVRAVMVGSLLYAVLGVLLLGPALRETAGPRAAVLAQLLLLYGTFLYWYVTYEPLMSHALSFAAACAVVACWWPGREELSVRRAAALGLLVGVSACVRWQNGVLLLLPAATLLLRLRRAPAPTVLAGASCLGAFVAGALPQMLAWKVIFGQYLLADPPHGRDFLRLDHPYLLQTFFSSRHGLLYWTPLLWLGFLGLLALLGRREHRRLAAILLVPVALMSYVNACSGDWWAGGSFSNRRFDSVLPLLAFGLAAAVEAARRLAARRPAVLLAAAALAATTWNLLFMEQYRRNLVPRDATVSFADVAANNASLVAATVGTPLAWPANWVFAVETGLPADRFDAAVGKYLFYRQNNLGGVIEVGAAEGNRADQALLAEGWSVRRRCGEGAVCRQVEGEARLLAPLDVAETLEVSVVAQGERHLHLTVNGRPAATFTLDGALRERTAVVPSGAWRRELNDVRLRAEGTALVDRVLFRRLGAR
jgi:hypothetical protein